MFLIAYHTTPINATEGKNPQKRPEPFEICDNANKVDYKILLMPEGHNPKVYGAVMRTPTDGLINIKFPMASTDEYANDIHIGLKERAREWKIFIIPLTETELQNNSDLDINIELVKRRWQQNIQIVSKFKINLKLHKSRNLFSQLM